MSKSSPIFMCGNCGNELTKWVGQCPYCKEWNTITEISLATTKPSTHSRSHQTTVLTPKEALKNTNTTAVATDITELDRVLGRGLTPGGVYLLAGEPGIGKSTLLTQLSISLSAKKLTVLYLCSEENPSQVAGRIDRLNQNQPGNDHIHLLQTETIEELSDHTAKHKPDLVIVDSIQSVASTEIHSTPGTITQIRACANLLINLAKKTSIPVILVGHVTKSGELAGPKLLEHMVDVVLKLEGDRYHDLRLLRGLKNRFGPTDETGIFTMGSSGLSALTDPTKAFTSLTVAGAPGSVLTLAMEGTRPLLIEIQALTVHSELAIPRRVPQGITTTRLQLICAILTKHARLPLSDKDVFVNVTGGLTLKEPAADLAIALAIISSTKNVGLPAKTVVIGELGLLGEIRQVPYLEKRLKEAKALGYTHPISPQNSTHIKQLTLK